MEQRVCMIALWIEGGKVTQEVLSVHPEQSSCNRAKQLEQHPNSIPDLSIMSSQTVH